MNARLAALEGLVPPMITPLTPEGEIDRNDLERLVNHLLDSGVSGLFILGTSGEGPWLTSRQSEALMRYTVEAVNGRVPVLAGVLEPSTPRTIEAIKRAVDCGVDTVVVTTPYYMEADASVQRYHLEQAAQISPLPVLLYNIPSKTHNILAPQTVREVLHITNIIGIKDSAGDWQAFEALLALRHERPTFKIFQGAEQLSARSLAAGADGVVPGLGNLVPVLFVEMIKNIKAGNVAAATALQEQVDWIGRLHTYGYWLACLKYAVSLSGLCSDVTCGQNGTLNETSKQAIRDLVTKHGV